MTYELSRLSEEVSASGRRGLTQEAGIDLSQGRLTYSTELGGFASHVINHPHTTKRQYSKPKPRSPGRGR